MRGFVVAIGVFFACVGPAFAGGPYMMVGAAEDVGKSPDYAFAKTEMDNAKLAGLDTIRVTQVWTKGQTELGGPDQIILGNAIKAAQFTGIRIVLSLYPFGSSVTPLTDQDRADFAKFVVDVAQRYPWVHDYIIGNEPNLNRFWMPQFNPDGTDAAAPAYEQLLATTYDALKAAEPHSTIYGAALAPRGVDKPNTGRDTHSPTAFINDMGAAYKASERAVPIMDAFAFHPYPESSSTSPNFPHPLSSSIGLADYGKLVQLLGTAFDGTAQKGSTLPILYDEFGIETQVPPSKAALYIANEPATTKPVDEATQAADYQLAMSMTFCQPNVLGLLLFHVQDEPDLSMWQSGLYYVDGSPKSSLPAVRAAADSVHRGVIATCTGMSLTPTVKLKAGKPTKTGVTVTLTCSLDCSYVASLDRGRAVRGTALGRTPTKVIFRAKLKKGRHSVAVKATATTNTGAPASAALTFKA